uniref:Retrotransposon protein, putative, Ty3-gypsy subclass n=1 Tax=Oryza sativa subsp. japonica TaxID=39947 RepID=Q2QS93_ORYSJ|nr:retrotransposon protein, putative, Ty3-gypsy subclass [Oryza sativa Japonica Group]
MEMTRRHLEKDLESWRIIEDVQVKVEAQSKSTSSAIQSPCNLVCIIDVDTATAESKAADATTISPTTSTSSDASRNQDQSESQFVFQEQAPATSDSMPPSLQQTSIAKPPLIPGATSDTYRRYGFQGQFLAKCSITRWTYLSKRPTIGHRAQERRKVQRDSSILQQRMQSMSQASDFNMVVNISHALHAAPTQWSGKKLTEELHQQ